LRRNKGRWLLYPMKLAAAGLLGIGERMTWYASLDGER
jgi:hypothetical protein